MHKGYQIFIIKFKKIDSQLIDPFCISNRINHFTYQLELFDNIHIHDMISITHLKSIIDSIKTPYQR